LALSAAAAVASSAPAGFRFAVPVEAVADFGAAGAPAFGALAGVVGFDAAAGAGFGSAAGAAGFDAAAGAGFDSAVFAAVAGLGSGVVGFDAGAVAAAGDPGFGFAAFLAAAGFFAAVPAFGFAALAGVAAAALDAVPAFGFAAVRDFGFAAFGFAVAAVADFGASFAPAFGVGLRALVPAARVRSVRVLLEAGAPVLVPPTRGAGAGVSAVISGSSPWSPRRRPVASDTTLRPTPTTPVMRSLGLMAMAPTVRAPRRIATRLASSAR
jgi:hypothetical protein